MPHVASKWSLVLCLPVLLSVGCMPGGSDPIQLHNSAGGKADGSVGQSVTLYNGGPGQVFTFSCNEWISCDITIQTTIVDEDELGAITDAAEAGKVVSTYKMTVQEADDGFSDYFEDVYEIDPATGGWEQADSMTIHRPPTGDYTVLLKLDDDIKQLIGMDSITYAVTASWH